MKPRRTSLPSDAAKPSEQAPSAPTPAANAGPSASASLRERLTQTRARMARAQARRPPQIDIDWDPDEIPTRSHDSLHSAPLFEPSASPQARTHARTRLGSGEVAIGHAFADPALADPANAADRARARPRERARSGEVPIGEHGEHDDAPTARAHPPRERARSGEVAIAQAPHVDPRASEPLDPDTFPSSPFVDWYSDAPQVGPADAREPQPQQARASETAAREPTARQAAPSSLPQPTRQPALRGRTLPGAVQAGTFFEQLKHVEPNDRPERAARPTPARGRARSGEVPIGTSFGQPMVVEPHASEALDPTTFPGASRRHARRVREPIVTPLSVEPAQHIAPISERPTRAPLRVALAREVHAVREHLQALYARMDHSERAQRNRVAACSAALLLLAAASPWLWKSRAPEPEPRKPAASALASQTASSPRNVSITVSSDPAGAEIFVDGRASSKVTPATVGELTPGKHVIGLQLAGYGDARQALRVPEDALLSIKLVSLNTPRAAPAALESRPLTRAEARAQARALARERRSAARAERVMSRYRTRMGLATEPAQPPTRAKREP